MKMNRYFSWFTQQQLAHKKWNVSQARFEPGWGE
jgi:hypothetical protein